MKNECIIYKAMLGPEGVAVIYKNTCLGGLNHVIESEIYEICGNLRIAKKRAKILNKQIITKEEV